MKKIELLKKVLEKKILTLDGAMGTMIQRENLTEQDFKGEKFKNLKRAYVWGTSISKSDIDDFNRKESKLKLIGGN